MNNPQEKITYGYMNKYGHIGALWSSTYDEALHDAENNQTNNRPYYILERTEHYEIVGEVKDNAPYQTGGKERDYDVECRNHSEMILNAQKARIRNEKRS